jgi:hypothetical protein
VCVSDRSKTWAKQLGSGVQVLEVAARQLVVGDDLDLAIGSGGDLDDLAEVSDAAVNLDLLVEELLEGRNVEDLVAGGLGSVDDELREDKLAISRVIPSPSEQANRGRPQDRCELRIDIPSWSPWGPCPWCWSSSVSQILT